MGHNSTGSKGQCKASPGRQVIDRKPIKQDDKDDNGKDNGCEKQDIPENQSQILDPSVSEESDLSKGNDHSQKKSCRIVAVEKPWLPRVNREEYSFALSPIVSPNRTKRSRMMPKVASSV